MGALLYCRVSTEEQVKFGYSLNAQEDALRKYCKENRLVVKGVYRDEGISGATVKKRKALQKMLSDAVSGDIILFTKLDRFSRNLLDANIIVKDLSKRNIGIRAIDEDDVDTSTADGKFIFDLKMSLSERERVKTGERIRSVFEYKVAKGEMITGKVPAGYKAEDHHYVIDPDKEGYIRDVFDIYEKTNSVTETVRRINGKYNLHLNQGNIRRKLKNRIYIGEFRGNAEYCEPIIEKKQFEHVQEMLKENIPKKRKNVYLFTGLIECPVCHKLLTSKVTTKENGNVIKSYVCCRKSVNECTFRKSVNEKKLESELIDMIPVFADREIHDYELRGNQNNKKEIEKIKSKLKRLKILFVEGDIEHDEYLSKKSEYNAQIKEYERTAVNDEVIKLKDMNIHAIYDMLDDTHKKIFWKHYIDRIIIGEDKHITGLHFKQ